MNTEKPRERPGVERPMSDLEKRILELYRQLPAEKKVIMRLSAALTAAARRDSVRVETKEERDARWADEVIRCMSQLCPEQQRAALELLRMLATKHSVSGSNAKGGVL